MFISQTTDKNDLAKFFQVLQRYSKAGLSPNDSLERYVITVTNPIMKKIATSMLRDMRNGLDFASALRKFPDTFPAFIVGLIEVGQVSGQLGKVLDEIVFHLTQEQDIDRKLRTALLVPKISIVGILIALSIALVFVIPKIGELLEDAHVELPLVTKMTIAFGNLAQEFWWLELALIVGGFMAYRFFKKNYPEEMDMINLKIPFFKVITFNRIQYDFSKTFGLCIEAGIQPQQALKYAAVAVNNISLKGALNRASNAMVNSGIEISAALKKEDKREILDKDFYIMLKTGAESGNLGDVMLNEAESFRKEMLAASELIGDKVSLSVTIPSYIALIILFASIEIPVMTMMQNLGASSGTGGVGM